jgi:hypothetical protein
MTNSELVSYLEAAKAAALASPGYRLPSVTRNTRRRKQTGMQGYTATALEANIITISKAQTKMNDNNNDTNKPKYITPEQQRINREKNTQKINQDTKRNYRINSAEKLKVISPPETKDPVAPVFSIFSKQKLN